MATGERFGTIFDEGTTLGLGPGELLGRFSADRDEAAFAALVAYHGPMVLATCRRILPDHADADDAFQATFLVLARRAGSISDPGRLAPWLHGVARRVSVKARAVAARRRAVEGMRPGSTEPPDPADARELRSILDEELARLPTKYREPLVLCYLEGLTHDEAAGQLKWPVGTVRSRLAGGRDRLRSRLARRGYAPTALATLTPATLPSAAVSRLLQAATVRLVFASTAGTVAPAAALLAQGVLTSMFVTKVQGLAAIAATTLALGTVGVVAAGPQFGAAGQAPAPAIPPAEPPKAVAPVGDQPAPVSPADLARQLDAARARIKALEAELAELTEQRRRGMASGVWRGAVPSGDRLGGASMPGGGMGNAMAGNAAGAPSGGGMMMGFGGGSGPGGGMGRGFSDGSNAGGRGMAFGAAGIADATGKLPGNSTSSPMLLGNGKILLVPPERNRVMVVDTTNGTRETFRPAGEITSLTPSISSGVAALGLQGPRITQVAAYSIQGDRWYPLDLREPVVGGQAIPAVSQDYAYYHLGRFYYAFSAQAKRWGVLELKEAATPRRARSPGGAFSNDLLMITEDDTLHVFNFLTGDWTHINTKEDPTPAPAATPAPAKDDK